MESTFGTGLVVEPSGNVWLFSASEGWALPRFAAAAVEFVAEKLNTNAIGLRSEYDS